MVELVVANAVQGVWSDNPGRCAVVSLLWTERLLGTAVATITRETVAGTIAATITSLAGVSVSDVLRVLSAGCSGSVRRLLSVNG